MGCSDHTPLKQASKTEIGDSVFHTRDKTQEGSHLDIRDIFQGESNAPFTSPQGCDPMVQLIAVEYHQGAGSQCQRVGLGLMISIIAVKLILKPAARLIDKTYQNGITPSLVIRGVVMPTHMILRFRVIIKRIGMGITYRTEEQIPLGEFIQPSAPFRQSIKLSKHGGEAIEIKPADTAPFLVLGDIVSMDLGLKRRKTSNESLQYRAGQEMLDHQKFILRLKFGFKFFSVQGSQGVVKFRLPVHTSIILFG
jgi:hypothetical protein